MRVWLHIGLEKTGTTSIQAECSRNAPALRTHGILYPSGLGDSNHAHLAIAAADLRLSADLRLRAGIHTEAELRTFADAAFASLAMQVRRAKPDTLLLSSEHFSSRLTSPYAVARLRAAILELSGDIRVLLYLRRQDTALLSLYSTFLKSGGVQGVQFLAERVFWLDFEAVVNLWSDAFGGDRIDVRLFPPAGGSLLEDFSAAVGLPFLGQAVPDERANRALDRRNAILLAKLNERLPAARDGRANLDREGLARFLEARSDGPALTMPPDERRALLARFERGNEAVRARYFPDRRSLFEPVSEPQDPPLELTVADAVDLAVEIWAENARLAARVRELERATPRGRLSRLVRRLDRLRRSFGKV